MSTTVIVAVKNGADFLESALQSLTDQQDAVAEILVVDGGSTDGSQNIALGRGARVIAQDTPGLAGAWNAGVRAARTSFIAFLDSDDLRLPRTIEIQEKHLLARPELLVCYGKVRHFLDANCVEPPRAKLDILLSDRSAPIPGTMLFRREAFDRIGFFEERLVTAADGDWVARCLAEPGLIGEVGELVLLKRLHGSNLTRQIDLVQSEMLELIRNKVRRRAAAQR